MGVAVLQRLYKYTYTSTSIIQEYAYEHAAYNIHLPKRWENKGKYFLKALFSTSLHTFFYIGPPVYTDWLPLS